VEAWIGTHETVSIEKVRDYSEEQYGGVSQSKQSYYEFLEAGGMSYHRPEPSNPKREDVQGGERREEIKKTGDAAGRD
jgi:transposase